MAIRSDIPKVLGELAKGAGIHRGELSRRFHQIKSSGCTPRPPDVNFIDDTNGNVYDGPGGKIGHYIGNLFDDF